MYKNDIIAGRIEFLQWKKRGEGYGDPQADENDSYIPEGFEPVTDGCLNNEKTDISSLTDDDLPF